MRQALYQHQRHSLAATGALLYCFGQHLEIVSVCAFTVCLGIAVDDTIHFLTRYHEQLASADDQESAIRNAFVGVGTALIMTTTVLVIGFAAALTSDARDHRIFAAMGMLTISTALLAEVGRRKATLVDYCAPAVNGAISVPEARRGTAAASAATTSPAPSSGMRATAS